MSVAYGVAPRIHGVYVEGQAAERREDCKFYISLPHDADRSKLSVTFDTGCEAIVDDLGNDILRSGRIDLTTPRTLTLARRHDGSVHARGMLQPTPRNVYRHSGRD